MPDRKLRRMIPFAAALMLSGCAANKQSAPETYQPATTCEGVREELGQLLKADRELLKDEGSFLSSLSDKDKETIREINESAIQSRLRKLAEMGCEEGSV